MNTIRQQTICRPGVEILPSGDERGLDPRDLDPADLIALGHEPMSPLKALRLHCVECCCGSTSEVRMCVSVRCPAWPFRMGTSPWRAERQITDEQREELRERGRALSARTHAKLATLGKLTSGDERTDLPATPVAPNPSDDSDKAGDSAVDRRAA
jgi:hypothetical protein